MSKDKIEYLGEFGEFVKDNPVPSLPEFLNSIGLEYKPGCEKWIEEALKEKYQKEHGVETNNEQPSPAPYQKYSNNKIELFECIKPTATLTKGRKYYGFQKWKYMGIWINDDIQTVHVVNDKGNHLCYKHDRFRLMR